MEQKNFITGDLWLASALSLLLKTNPSFTVSNGRTLFIFPGDNKTYKAIAAFNDNCTLPSFEFVSVIKQLKAEMISRRFGGRHE